MPKNNRNGQAKILTNLEFSKIRRELRCDADRLLFDVMRYTGERVGAVIQLQISDCYGQAKPLDYITYRGVTRKAVGKGTKRHFTRQVAVHPSLFESLADYPIERGQVWLFPSSRAEELHISRRAADLIIRKAVDRAGLGSKGISTHSFRRTLITDLASKGVGLRVIQKLTGHKTLSSVQEYIDVSDDQQRAAIALL